MQEGGSQYAVPPQEMTPFAAAGGVSRMPAGGSEPEVAASDPVGGGGGGGGGRQLPTREGFPDEDAALLGEAERGGGASGCNRWPREETLALLRIRSEMDAVFRDATLKGPLWEGVSRKLAELGYNRSAKKCKEKFENVHKYYKRTKDGRAGRQDGKSYRFFSQLEALHSSGSAAASTAAVPVPGGGAPPVVIDQSAPIPGSTAAIGIVGSSTRLQPTPLNAIPLSMGAPGHVVPDPMAAGGAATPGVGYPPGCVSFSSNDGSSSGSESEGEDTEEGEDHTRKRKRGGGGGWPGSRKMMAFFEGLMKQVMERQEAMQQRFLEMIEKREQDRMIREEAWRRQEMARLSREHEIVAQEREVSAARDATIIAFLQKMTGQTVVPAPPAATPPPSAPSHAAAGGAPPPVSQQPAAPPPPYQQLPQPPAQHFTTVAGRLAGADSRNLLQASSLELVSFSTAERASAAAGAGGIGGADPASSRWPKPEVHALIRLRSGMETRYQEAGPKGPLWEEIAAEMRRLGYNRSAKRCKEKWENINKYFKKVKDGNKKRPEDAKTCPYFHQLDALYRKKVLGVGAGGSFFTTQQDPEPAGGGGATSELPEGTVAPPPPPPSVQHGEGGQVKSNGNNPDGNSVPTSTTNFLGGGGGGGGKEPEDLVKALREQRPQQPPAAATEDYDKMEETDSDSMDQDDDNDDDGDDEKMKMAFQIEYQQRPNVVNGTATNGAGNQPPAAAAAAGSFMAMVQ